MISWTFLVTVLIHDTDLTHPSTLTWGCRSSDWLHLSLHWWFSLEYYLGPYLWSQHQALFSCSTGWGIGFRSHVHIARSLSSFWTHLWSASSTALFVTRCLQDTAPMLGHTCSAAKSSSWYYQIILASYYCCCFGCYLVCSMLTQRGWSLKQPAVPLGQLFHLLVKRWCRYTNSHGILRWERSFEP